MPTVKGDSMRGLAVFITDIRNCKSKEAELRRINKELANIRSKFKGDKTMDGYQKKKYVCKLLFIFLLGHDIDFGHQEAVNLLCSNRYTEKQIGYLFISVLVSENSTLINLVMQRLKDDLNSRNPIFVNLALQCIANIGSREMVENFAPEIPKLLVSGDTIDTVKQSASLCLLKLIRTAPEAVSYGEWTSRVIHLLNDQHMGVVTAAASLIEALVKRNPDDFKGCVSLAISRLSRIVTASYTDLQDYTYYFVPAPWLSVKLLKLLQNYPPPDDPSLRSRLNECLESILNKAQEAPKSKKVQHSNAKNAVLFEAINLIIHLDCDPGLLVRACNQLGQFLQHRETNLRYLALESMCLLATSEFSHEAVKKHQETVVGALKSERDVSVRQRAVDLLYAMCDRSNAENIVTEMLAYLEKADYSIREEMVLKVAILAEKYAVDYTWYVDTILNLIRIAGDYVSEEVWYRVIQIVINREDVQGYAAKTVFEALQAPACHENMVKVGGYILGEFGNLIAGDPRSCPSIQFQLLHSKFHLCSVTTRQLLLSTYMKFINLFPEIKGEIQEVLLSDMNSRNSDVEIQQRSVEYYHLSRLATEEVLATVLEEMPPFPERESSILSKLKQKRPAGALNDGAAAASGRGRARGGGSAASATNATSAVTSSATPDASALTSLPAGGPAQVGNLLDLDGGLSTTPSFEPPAANGTSGGRDIFDELLGGGPTPQRPPTGTALVTNNATFEPPPTEDNFTKLVCKTSGVLFENDVLQIGIRAEFRGNLARFGVYYGNKSGSTLTQFVPEIRVPPEVGDDPGLDPPLSIQTKHVATQVEAGTQLQQMVNVECVRDFTLVPRLIINFLYAGARQTLNLRLPLHVGRFMVGTDMNQQIFFQRWKALSAPNQECQKIFKQKTPMDKELISGKLTGMGLSILANVDPSPINYVGAGIIHTTSQQIGVLLRLEPSQQTQMYRLTVRSFREKVARRICELLEEQL